MSKYPVFDTILARRSVRSFIDKKVEKEKIEMLLKAAMAAPSACNLQPWAFIVVDEEKALESLKECTNQGKYNAPLAIVVCGVYKHIPWDSDAWMQDCKGAAQNIMLEAVELGLSSVCIGGFDGVELSKTLDIPEDVAPLCIIEIGYSQSIKAPLTWYDSSYVHYQKFDRKKKRTIRTLQMLQDDIKKGII